MVTLNYDSPNRFFNISDLFLRDFFYHYLRDLLKNALTLSCLAWYTYPIVIVLRYNNSVDIIPSPAVPQHNPVLVCTAQEVPVQVHGEVPGLLLQHEGGVVHLDAVHQVALVTVAVDLATLREVSENNNEVSSGARAEVRSVSI